MTVMENTPELWQELIPFPIKTSHKYTRGHAVVVGGPMRSTGAARLSALSALRAGAGLVTLACPAAALPVYAASLTAVMTAPFSNIEEFKACIEAKHADTVLLGPGNGVNEHTREQVLAALSLKKRCVLDADALTVFEGRAEELFRAIAQPVVLTPHEGEFKRLFSLEENREESVMAAAKTSGAVVVLKGAETLIASPEGKLAINRNAPPWLATAGSGDVLAGLITGLFAQGMPAWEAACAAVWMHGEAGTLAGVGLIAEDLPGMMPKVLRGLL